MKFFSSSKSIATAAVALCAACSSLRADTVTATFSAQDPGSALGGVSGTNLHIGALVRFGYFHSSVDFGAMSNDLSLLNANFTELSSVKVGYFEAQTVYNSSLQVVSQNEGTNYGVMGVFSGKVSLDPSLFGLESTRLYMWAYDTDSVTTATAHGIFSDNTWMLGSFGTRTFDLASVNPLNPNHFYYAAEGPEMSQGGVGGPLNKLMAVVPVPEPGPVLLGLLAAVSLFTLRRRPTHEM